MRHLAFAPPLRYALPLLPATSPPSSHHPAAPVPHGIAPCLPSSPVAPPLLVAYFSATTAPLRPRLLPASLSLRESPQPSKPNTHCLGGREKKNQVIGQTGHFRSTDGVDGAILFSSSSRGNKGVIFPIYMRQNKGVFNFYQGWASMIYSDSQK